MGGICVKIFCNRLLCTRVSFVDATLACLLLDFIGVDFLERAFAVDLFFDKNNHYIVVLSINIYIYCNVVCSKFFRLNLLVSYLLFRVSESFNFSFSKFILSFH